MRRDGTVDLLRQLIDGYLAGGHLRSKQLVEELGPAHARDQGALALGDPALRLSADVRQEFATMARGQRDL
jgi:hypothetical protein